jgi:hypothetical protein
VGGFAVNELPQQEGESLELPPLGAERAPLVREGFDEGVGVFLRVVTFPCILRIELEVSLADFGEKLEDVPPVYEEVVIKTPVFRGAANLWDAGGHD